jgi:hypothetical protein
MTPKRKAESFASGAAWNSSLLAGPPQLSEARERKLLPSLRRRLRGAVGTKTEARCFAGEYVSILLTNDGHRRGVRGNSIGWKPRNPRMSPSVAVRSLPDPLHSVSVRQACRHSKATRNGPLLRKNSRTNANRLGESIKIAFQQMNPCQQHIERDSVPSRLPIFCLALRGKYRHATFQSARADKG